jgi:hypothetical protein
MTTAMGGRHRLFRYDRAGNLLNTPLWRSNEIRTDGMNHFLAVTNGSSTDRLGNGTQLRVRNTGGTTVHTYNFNVVSYPQTSELGTAPERFLQFRWEDRDEVARTDMKHLDVMSPAGVWFSTADMGYGDKPALEVWIFEYELSIGPPTAPFVQEGIDRMIGNFARADYGGAFTPSNLLAEIRTSGGAAFGEAVSPHVIADVSSTPKRLRMDFTFWGSQGQGDWGSGARMIVWHIGGTPVKLRDAVTGTSGVKGPGEQWTWPYEFLITPT